MKLMKRLGDKVARVTGKTGLKIAAHSPTIFVIGGILITGIGTVLACRATLNAHEVLDKHDERINDINRAKEVATEDNPYPDEQYKKDLAVAYVQSVYDWTKLFALPALVGGLGILCIVKGHLILRDRYFHVIAAYNILDKSYKVLFNRVSEEHGEDTAYMYANNLRKETVERLEVDEDGKTKKVKEISLVSRDPNGPNGPSMYSRFFDESSPQWITDPIHNLAYLMGVQRTTNDTLKAKGYVFLNDVYDMLGVECSEAGQIVGWVLDDENSDGFVDFGIHKPGNERFVNGYEKSCLLDFNVTGVVYDKVFRQ